MAALNDKQVIIVTGGSRGLGREIALAFGRAGSRIVVNYLNREQDAATVAEQIAKTGGDALTVRADVGDVDQVEAMIALAADRWGNIDVLVNNAGIARDALILRMKEQDWDMVLRTNLNGPFKCIRSVSRLMKEQGTGHIINIASITGIKGREGQANYSASKAGLIGLTRECARELGRFNIRVNAVLPGYLPTAMGEKVSAAVLDRVLTDNVLNRFSDPIEVAEFIVHLSRMNNVSGQVFNLDSRIV